MRKTQTEGGVTGYLQELAGTEEMGVQDRNSLCESIFNTGVLDRENQGSVILRTRRHPCPPGVDL